MGHIVQKVEYAPRTGYAYKRNRGIGTRKEEVFVQTKHFGCISVNNTTMRKDHYALPDVVAGNFIDRRNHALAEGFGRLALWQRIPTSGAPCPPYNLHLACLQSLCEYLQIIAFFDHRNGNNVA